MISLILRQIYTPTSRQLLVEVGQGVSSHTVTPPDVVAKAVLKSVTSENPSMRYLAGKDVGIKDGRRRTNTTNF